MQLFYGLFRFSTSLVVWMLLQSAPTLAQIAVDETLGNERSSVRTTTINQQPVDLIEGGARRGDNLFHSFSDFNVREGQQVYFDHPDEVQRILSRVTGNQQSRILGTLGVTGNADLFLLNPNGIIFGPNARLDIRGSFLATTANSFVFPNGSEFSTINPQAPPLLTVNVPIGLQFGNNPGRIINQSVVQSQDSAGNPILDPGGEDPVKGLRVLPRQTLALVGGDIAMPGGGLVAGGQPTTPSGRIELGSVAGPGQVSLAATNEGWDLEYTGIQNFGSIELSQAAAINANGVGGGTVQFQGGRITLTEGSQIFAYTYGAQPGRALVVNASESLLLRDISAEGLNSLLVTGTEGTGRAGNLDISTQQLRIRNGAAIFSSTFGEGQSGTIEVRVSDSIEVSGWSSALVTETHSSGSAENVLVFTSRLDIRDGAQVGSYTRTRESTGQGGDVRVIASERVAVIDGTNIPEVENRQRGSLLIAQTNGAGSAGNLTIETDQLLVRGGGQVNTITLGRGDAGNLTVRSDDVELAGVLLDANGNPRLTETELPIPSGLLSGTESSGNGETLRVETQQLSLRDGAVLQSATYGSGDAGDLIVRADDFIDASGTARNNISPTGIIAYSGGIPEQEDFGSVSTATGAGGDARITTGELIIRDGAVVATGSINSTQEVEAGDLNVDAQTLTLDNQGSLLANTNSGNGGDIILQTGDLLELRRGSQISTTSGLEEAGGNGGNIIISAGTVNAVPGEDSDIVARAYRGQGGNIIIVSRDISGLEERQATPGNGTNDIDASSEFGESGTVITTPVLVPDELVSVDFGNPELVQGCQVEGGVASAEFFNTGRGGVPPSPYDPLSNDDVLDDVRLPVQQNVPSEDTDSLSDPIPPDRIVEAQGWIVNDKGQVVLMAEAPDPQLSTQCQLR